MAHFVLLDADNMIVDLKVIDNSRVNNLEYPESELVGRAFLNSLGFAGDYIQTSYNGSFRYNYGDIGMKYNPKVDSFYEPVPVSPEMKFDEKTQRWVAP